MEILGYQIIRELGRGGMATVYLAVQQSLGRQVALKVMNPSLATDGDFRERFYREGHVIARLVHPQIVTVYDFESRGDKHFLSMEHLSGGSLKERIEKGLQPEQSAKIIAPIANALTYAHRQGVVHRDVKPQNILFRADDVPVLTDFGIARVLDVDSHLTQTGVTIGSPRYMSPEQVLGRPVDSRSDIYSLGIVFYEMLTGDIPWSDTASPIGLAMKHCTAPIPILDKKLQRYQGIIEKSLATEPDDRYQNADDFASELSALVKADSYVTELPTVITTSPTSPKHETKKRPDAEAKQTRATKSRPRPIGVIIFLAIVLITVGGYFGKVHFIDETDDTFLLGLKLPRGTNDRPIASNYEALAIQHLRSQQLNLSMKLIQGGLKVVPKDERLIALQAIVQRHQAARGHLEAATRHFQRGMLEASSLEIEKGLEALPDHEKLWQLQGQLQVQLQERRARKAKQLLEQAQRHFQAGDLDASLARISEGLWQVPDHQGHLSLRGEIAEQVARRRQVDGFLEQAHQLEQQERWQKALETVREGMSIDADDPRLKATEERLEAGLRRYRTEETDRILAEASRQRDLGDFEASFGLIDDGLWLVPEHTGLLGLRSEIQQTIKHSQKAQALLVKARQRAAEDDLDTSLQLIVEGLSLSSDDQALLEFKQQVEAGIQERTNQEAKTLYTQAVALEHVGEFEESLSLVNRGLALTPGDEQLLALRDRLQHDIAQHAERTQKASALFAQAQERLKTDAPQDAIELTEKILTLVPEHAGALALQRQANEAIALEKARVRANEFLANTRQLLSDGRLEEARSLVAQGLTEIPDNVDLLTLRNQIDAEIEAQEQQQAEIEQRRANEAQSADLRSQAQVKLDAGAPDEALDHVEHALRLTPDNADAMALRGRISEQLDLRRTVVDYLADAQRLKDEGALEQSLKKIGAALQLVPNTPEAVALRTQVAAEIEYKAQQQRKLNEQQRRHEQAAALLNQAQQIRDQGQLERGLTIVQQGLELTPDNRQLSELQIALQEAIKKRYANAARTADLLVQAKSKLDAGAPDEALGLVESALQISPKNPEGRELLKTVSEQLDLRRSVANYLADAKRLEAEGELEQSLDKIGAALQLAPSTPEAVALRTQVAAEIEQKAQAQRELTEQQRKREQAADLLSQAQQMRDQGELEKGLSIVQQGLKLTPNDTRLSELQVALETVIGRRQANAGQASELRARALAKRKAGALNQALELMDQALRLTPADAGLSSLHQEIQAESDTHQTIEGYLVDALRLTGEGDLAQGIELIDKALQHANDAAQRGVLGEEAVAEIERRSDSQRRVIEEQQRRRTAANRLIEALRKKSEGDLAASLALVEQGLEATPANTELTDLAAELRTEIARQRAIEQENNAAEEAKARVEALLRQCREYQSAKRLTTGKGGTAFQCYNDVLMIESGNEAAREGLQQIADQYAAWAVSALVGNNLSSARTYIKRLATVDPEHGELGNLRQRLDKLRKAAAATPKPRRNTASGSSSAKSKAPTRKKTQSSRRKKAPVVTRKAPVYTPPKQTPTPSRKSMPKVQKDKRPVVGGF